MPPIFTPASVNTIGHSAGVLLFGIFLYLVLRRRSIEPGRNALPLAAAALALLWNLVSLIALTLQGGTVERYLAAIGFSLLSILPAILLQLSLKEAAVSPFPWLIRAGYALSAFAVLLHAVELASDADNLHRLGLLVITGGFGALTAVAVLRSVSHGRQSTSRLLGAMSLFLFAISFAHFGEGHLEQAWAEELAFHHAGIPLALFVLMQEYRFVLIDAFIRLLANGLLAGIFGLLIVTQLRTQPLALQAIAAAVAVALFAWSRDAVQTLLNRVIFRRPSAQRLDSALEFLRAHRDDEAAYLRDSAQTIAALVGAPLLESPQSAPDGLLFPTRTNDLRDFQRQGVRVIVPIRLSLGDTRHVLLGDRHGGRPYLSEDLEALARLAAAVAEQVERIRAAETTRLVAQAELRALQAQIHPHFLFNALNTLYGIIPREAQAARKTVLNLADIFRYFLRSDKAFVLLEEELNIVNAYLAIEAQRLGSRLRLEVSVDPTLLREPIPVLSIEPLVENAIKHGIAARTEGGIVRIEIEREGETMLVSIFDDGPGFAPKRATERAGVGLDNVNRRLQLSYGPSSEVRIERSQQGTRVSFRAPCSNHSEPRAVASGIPS